MKYIGFAFKCSFEPSFYWFNPHFTVISPVVHEIKPTSERNYPYYGSDTSLNNQNRQKGLKNWIIGCLEYNTWKCLILNLKSGSHFAKSFRRGLEASYHNALSQSMSYNNSSDESSILSRAQWFRTNDFLFSHIYERARILSNSRFWAFIKPPKPYVIPDVYVWWEI